MKNINFIKNLTAGVALAMAIYPQAWAGVATPCGQQAGDTSSNCWSCGDDCTARLDSYGKLSIYGSGTMNDYGYSAGGQFGASYHTNAPWYSRVADITNLDISGVTNIGVEAFEGLMKLQNVSIGDSVIEIGSGSLGCCGYSTIYIPPSVTYIGGNALSFNPNLSQVIVDSSTEFDKQYQDGYDKLNFLRYKKEDNSIYLYDSNNNIKGIFDSQSDLKDAVLGNGQARIEYDTNGNFTVYNSTGGKGVKYAANGDLIARYIKGADGSTSIYDANGKLTGLKNAKSITPAQAAALVKKGNHNRVTLTFK